jgi:hypothetical protein
VEINQKFSELADDALATYAAQIRAAFEAIAALDAPSEAQVTEAEGYADHLDAITALQAERVTAAEALATRSAALRTRFSTEPVEETGDEDENDDEDEEAVEGEVEEVPVETTTQPPTKARSGVVTLSRKVKRPVKPAATRNPISITAAADVPDFSTGAKMGDLTEVGKAMVNRMRGFGTPSGDGSIEDLRHAGVASFKLEFPKELTIDRGSDDMEVMAEAAREARLPGGSLVAAGGWCAPSETIYDLCAGETTDGIVSIPEVNVARGGIRYTRGPDFSDIYTNAGFCQTEAQAIAGTTKPCIEVPCPPFVEVRLDACGICIKAPILTNAAYPELVQRYISGSMIAHQHKMNNKVLTAITSGSTAKTATGLGAVSTDTFEALTIYGNQTRQKYRLGINSSLEVLVPFWVKDVIKLDIARRNAIAVEVVTDAVVASEFSAYNLAVQYAYDWQELPYADVTGPPAVDADKWPTTFKAVLYPAGTWIKGTADIINLNAVYDAASLATNIYTALFFEQGILVAKQCYDSLAVEIPVCTAGRSGAANLTCA